MLEAFCTTCALLLAAAGVLEVVADALRTREALKEHDRE